RPDVQPIQEFRDCACQLKLWTDTARRSRSPCEAATDALFATAPAAVWLCRPTQPSPTPHFASAAGT
ncbi:MAG: hypothetical protein WA988_09625, partial [Candidatus Nanopelagicales bacterium]